MGKPCTFIRLAGCPLNCVYCDTRQAIPFDSGVSRKLVELIASLHSYTTDLVLVTGGEPLAQKNCIPLLSSLCERYAYVQLETSGAYDIARVPEKVAIILDIKTPGSGEVKRNIWTNMQQLRANTEIKFVLTSRADYEWAKEIIGKYKLTNQCEVLMSCCWGEVLAKDVVEWILEDGLNVRFQLQLHKVIWGAEVSGV